MDDAIMEKRMSEMLAFADRHLAPYTVRRKQDGATEIVPKLCPFCHGGDNGDENSFALSVDYGVYVCKRGSCGKRGRFQSLAGFFGDEASGIGIPVSRSKAPPTYKLPEVELSPPTEEIYAYFERRKISRGTVDAFSICSDSKGNIVFPFFEDGQLVFVKFRKPKKHQPGDKSPKEWREPGTKAILFGMDACSFSKPLVISEGQCFPGDAEILTESGWVQFSEYDGASRVCEVHDDLTAEFVTPYAITKKKYEGDLIEVNIGGNYTSKTTPDHNIVLRSKSGEITKIHASDVRNGKWTDIPTVVHMDGVGIPLTNDQIALYLAVCADCTIDNRKTVRHCRFGVKKKRKYERLKGILDRLGIPYHDSGLSQESKYYYIGFRTPDYIVSKRLPLSWCSEATFEQRRFIIEEMVHWDGNHVSGRNQYEFSSSFYEDAVVMQTIAHTSGYMSTIMKRTTKYHYAGEVRSGTIYKVSILKGKSYVSTQAWKPKRVWHTGYVYCVSVPSGMILVRQNGHITVSGNCDSMALYEAGIQNVVSVPSGCEDMSWIENCWDFLEKFKTIILFGDNDDPGRRMVQTVAHRLDETRCLIVEDYPPKPTGGLCKDANEILFYHGEMKLVEMVESAREIPVCGLINLGKVVPVAQDSIPSIRTGIPKLDWAVRGLREGSISVFTGKPGHGKSTLLGLFALQAVEQGKNVCVYSGELTPEAFQEWIDLQCAGSEYIGLRKDAEGNPIPCISQAVQQRIIEYYNNKIFLFDNEEIFENESEADAILRIFRLAYRRENCRLYVIDNLMTALSDSDDELVAQKKFVGAMKKFARKYGVHVIITAHPRKNKAGAHLEGEDVGGNSAINNLADFTVAMERPNIRIIKNRVTGWLGLIDCIYCPDSRRIYQSDVGDQNRFSWNKAGIEPPKVRADSLPEFQEQLAESLPI